MRKKELPLEEEIAMREAIENQIFINEQEEERASLEAKYNSAEEDRKSTRLNSSHLA